MIQRPNPQSIPRPHPPQEDLLTRFGPFIVLVPLAVMVSAVVVPAAAVGLIGAALASALRLRWWALVVMSVVALVVFVSLGMDPIKRVETVIKRTQGAWMSPKGDTSTDLEFGKKARGGKNRQTDMFDRLEKRIPSLMRTGLPASIPIGFLLGAIFLAWTQRDTELRPGADAQHSSKTRKGRVQARKRVRSAPEAIGGRAVLGASISGDLPHEWLARKPFGGEFVVLDEGNLGRHLVIVGQPGSGKTVSLLQLAYLATKVYGWRVYFLDGKGDHATMREFMSLMLAAGVSPSEIGAFPNCPFDGWRTSGDFQQGYSQLLNRLMGAVTFTEPYYRDMTRRFLSKALRMGDALPRSSSELLERLDRLATEAPSEPKHEARTTHARYEALFDSFPGQFDGGWSFSDHRVGYVLLKGLSNRDEANNAAGYLFECFKQFATDMKPEEDRVLLIVDEFPAVQEDADVAGLVERLRSFGCSVALSAQSYEGLGASRDRIIRAARSLILHSCPGAEEIVRLAGTQEAYNLTHQVDYQVGPTGLGSARAEQRFRVDPNLLGSLHEGEAFVISQRRAQLIRLMQRSVSEAAYQQAAELLRPKAHVERLEQSTVTPPKQSDLKRAIDW
jgi:hypothetical protein